MMRFRRCLRLSSALAGLAFGGALLADSPEGYWLTEAGTAQVEIRPCGEDTYCGYTVWLEDPHDERGELRRDVNNPEEELRDRELVGLKILWDMTPARRDGRWDGGRVYDPENGNTYRARMDLVDPDTLELRGYVGSPLFGRTTVWAREEERRPLSE
ncbi:MAG: DUF2147 domain-containing protein [Ectothiorhodospiraceae bacterium]|nr:DUF2147 domain-containing protein [Ectothiorhodospiraceae bacterium]